jgi:chemotaxis family two-component system sensor kinase Cph1
MKDFSSAMDAADLAACDREPIHIPGSIQPHGVLLALDPNTLRVVQVAGDTERLLNISQHDLLHQEAAASLGSNEVERLRAMVSGRAPLPRPMFAFDTVMKRDGRNLDVIVHVSEGIIVIELEPRIEDAVPNPLAFVQSTIMRLQGLGGVAAFLQGIADEVRSATGFDRVMIYQFQPDESGAVVAEARSDEVESYLGLHYPASDIPQQARALYLRNWLRLIPDARYTPAPITPAVNPVTGRPLDLTHSALRSVSPIHLEYLANMGVRASMSLSLVVDGKLWGLIALHHRQPKHMPQGQRAGCELLAQLASLQLADKVAKEEQTDRLQAKITQAKLVEAMMREEQVAAALIERDPSLIDYIPAGGAAVFWEGKISTAGNTPSQAEIEGLVAWLNENLTDGVFITNHLPGHYHSAQSFAGVASGLVALSVSRSPRDYVLWFKPEVLETVTWAGNPNEAVKVAAEGARLSPRHSFAAWRETVRGRSEAWRSYTLELAQTLRTSILEVALRRIDQAAREREQARAHQDFLMAELDHRVKNTLATIQSLVKYSAATAKNLENFVGTVQDRLQAMLRAHSRLTQSQWQGGDLRVMIEDEIAPYGGMDRVTVAGRSIVLKPKAALCLGLAIHELATNAAKYGALSTPEGRVDVEWLADEGSDSRSLLLRWSERGGPPTSPPTHHGFGRTVLERTLAFELGGAVDLRFLPGGVVCIADIPIDQIIESGVTPAAGAPRPSN